MLAEYLLIGEIVKPQGVHGQVKVKPYTDDPERFFDLEKVYLTKNGQYTALEMECQRVHEDMVYLTLEGVATREGAEALRGEKLYVDRAHAVELAEDEVFICDLIGCEAVDRQGNKLGTLKDVLQPATTDVYVFDTPKGEMMMPALKAAIPEIDVAARRIVINEDMLDEVALFAD